MFKPIECWVCGNDMNYICDKEIEEMGYYRFDCTKCDESILCPKKAPFLEKKNVKNNLNKMRSKWRKEKCI